MVKLALNQADGEDRSHTLRRAVFGKSPAGRLSNDQNETTVRSFHYTIGRYRKQLH